MEETTINNNNMEEKLILNSIEDAEIISVRLSPDETPIAYENRVRCLMLSGLSREEAEKVALEPMDIELYYEIGVGLMAVDPAAVESGTIWSPYTRELYDNSQRMRGIIDDMVKLKMIMYIDQGYNLCFLPGDKIEDLTMDETDGFVDTTGIVTSIKSKDVVEFYVENPFVKIKDE